MAKEPAQRKKAPRKASKRKPKKSYQSSEVSSVELPETRSLGVVRHEASLQFILDTAQRTIDWWHAQHFSHEVSLSVFRKWASEDQWISQRDSHWEQIHAAVARGLAGEMTRAHIDEAKQLVEARSMALRYVVGRDADNKVVPMPEIKSFEGVVSAFVKLDERLDKKREGLMGALPLGAPDSDPESEKTGVSFSPEEYQAMAQAIIRERHQLPETTEEPAADVGTGEGE